MRIFLTGATGFIGSAVSTQLIAAGYEVTGLTRSRQGAEMLAASGIEPFYGDIASPESLSRGVSMCDGVIHTAFNHDFSTFGANCETDRLVIEEIAKVLKGTNRPMLITSAVSLGSAGPGIMATENDFNTAHVNLRKASELACLVALQNGVNVSVIRLSQVHNASKQGLITPLIDVARRTGISAYIDGDEIRWSAVHLDDAARLYILALKKAAPGSRYHAVAEQGITLRAIAETIGDILNLPVKRIELSEAAEHFGWLSKFIAQDMSASSSLTQQLLGWQPTGPDLITDLKQMQL